MTKEEITKQILSTNSHKPVALKMKSAAIKAKEGRK